MKSTTGTHLRTQTPRKSSSDMSMANIGVTSNVQLIREQLGLLEEFNIYKWIAMNLRHSMFLEVW